MRKTLAVLIVIAVLLVTLALFMHLFLFGGSSGVAIPHVLHDGRFIGVRGDREVFRFFINDLLEVTKLEGGLTRFFGSVGFRYENEELTVYLDYGHIIYGVPPQ